MSRRKGKRRWQSRDHRSWSDTKQTIRYAPREYRMTFGKYKGQKIDDVPTDYLVWLEMEGISDDNLRLSEEIRKQLDIRGKPVEWLLWRMDSLISDDEFEQIAGELDRNGRIPGWGLPDHSRVAKR